MPKKLKTRKWPASSARIGVAAATMLALLLPVYPSAALATEDSNWRRGRIYYRMVCTDCHKEMAGEVISPMSRTISEWEAYVDADKHDATGKSDDSLRYYVSTSYRDSVKAENKAAAKFIDIPEEELLANLRAWVVHGAKDSDTPARCQ
jgi:hypothetical protein